MAEIGEAISRAEEILQTFYMAENKKWYAVYTKPRWEKKVVDLLARENFVTYCPLNRVIRQWSDRRKLLYEPLFTCYVFVQLGAGEISRVKCIHGIINFVCWLGKPAVIRDEEIEIIKRFLNDHTNVRLEKIQVNVNDVVRITDGPLMEYEGSILAVAKNKVKVYLPTLGYAMVAEVEKANLEVVRKAKETTYRY